MRYKIKLALFLVALAGFLYFLSTLNIAVFNPHGAIAAAEKKLIYVTFFLMLLVVVPVYVMIFVFSHRYRADNPHRHAAYAPDWASNSALEFAWWAVPTAIILTLAVITWKSTHELDPYKPLSNTTPPITIQVVALNWKWLFIYPDKHIATVNYVEFPANTPVNFMITSDAPMNSFWIPELGGQIYAMSGMTTQLHLIADHEGEYRGSSANFSGDGFAGMKFTARAVSDAEFSAWVEETQHSPSILSRATYPLLKEESKNVPPASYATPEEGLYNSIVMKYMMPADADMTESANGNMMGEMKGMENMSASSTNKGTPL